MELTPRRNFKLKGSWGLYLFSYIYIAIHDPACGSCDTALDDMVAIDLDVYGSHAAGMSEADDGLAFFRLYKLIYDRSREKRCGSCSDRDRDRVRFVERSTETARTQISIVSAGVRFPSMSL